MSFSIVYLVRQFFYRIYETIYGWYIGGFMNIGGVAVAIFNAMDQTLAFEITLRHLFEPLYQDRTVLGYILGFIFRLFRVLIGAVIYAVFFFIVLAIYLIWAAIPIAIVIWGINL